MAVINDSGILGIASRLQRLSETLRKDGFLIYKASGIDFEPKWFPVCFALHEKPGLSVVELAAEIGYTHPSTIALLKELEKIKLVGSKNHPTDDRKRLLYLSKNGELLINRMQPVWEIIKVTIEELIDSENNLMKAIIEVENRLNETSFFERSKKHIHSVKEKA